MDKLQKMTSKVSSPRQRSSLERQLKVSRQRLERWKLHRRRVELKRSRRYQRNKLEGILFRIMMSPLGGKGDEDG